MTLQDDLARPWFQPLVPSDTQQDRPRPNPAPLTTRIAGELPLDEAVVPSRPAERPAPPQWAPGPEQVEVTQPYIPAIRDEQPAFAKRLNPESTASAAVAEPTVRQPVPAPAPTPQEAAPTAPQPQTTAPPVDQQPPAAPPTAPAAPPKKKSLVRRVVRRIIGPDLLRKDPPKPPRR
jgi:hypothetical protein